MIQYNLIVKSVWGDNTKGNDDLVNLLDLTTIFLERNLAYRILTAETRGKMSDRYMEHTLGFSGSAELETAQKILASVPKLKRYTELK